MKKIIAIIALTALPACNSVTLGKTSIIASMERDLGKGRPSDCPSRWCACYLDKKLAANGYKRRGSHRAIDFASYGRATGANIGAIMVQRNHVGIVTGTCADGSIEAISGNHAKRVRIGCYSRRSIVAFRAID